MGISVFPAPGGGVTQKTQEFTSTGTFTVPSNCSTVEVFLVAGGGGGGSCSSANNYAGGGGGGGAIVHKTITVTPGSSYTVTIGAGGTTGSYGTATQGGNGGDTTFGSLATAIGGGGGARDDGNSRSGSNGGTGGGAPSNGGGTYNNGGSGGGAMASAFIPDSGRYSTLKPGTGSQGGSGAPGIGGGMWIIHPGGAGYLGYGGGGGGGVNYSNSDQPPCKGTNGGADGCTHSANAGTATANSGGGGGGGIGSGPSFHNSSAGASGYARVTYWS